MELDFFRLVDNITPTPPKFIILELKDCDIFAQIKVFHKFIVKSLPDHLVRIVHHLMHLDSDLILDTHLPSTVWTPTIQKSICHQSYCTGTAWLYFADRNFFFFFKILKIFICDWSIAIFCASISKNSILPASPEIYLSQVINSEIELASCCNSIDFHVFKIFDHFRLEDWILAPMA